MEELNVVNATQEPVVEVQEPASGEGVTLAQEPAKPVQTAEENSKFAQFRREKESAVREAERIKAENELLLKSLNNFGYKGSPQEVADALTAQKMEITVEEARFRREQEEKRAEESLLKHPEFLKLKEENERLHEIQMQSVFQMDVDAINKAFPDAKLKDISQLGETFMKLRANGIDTLIAYNAIKGTERPKPKEIGAVNAASTQEKDFYTPEEVDRLTKKQLDNPKTMAAVMKSMTKWRK